MLSEEEKYKIATEKVRKMKKFYRHLSSFMFTSIFLMVLFFFLRMPPWISFIVIAGWGIGIAGEAIEVFGFPGTGRSWEERKIEEEMQKLEDESPRVYQQREETIAEEDEAEDHLELPDYRKVSRKWDESDFV
jgi:hypothetical protein